MNMDNPPVELLQLASWTVRHQDDRFGLAGRAMDIAWQSGASKQAAWEVATSVAELASNAVKHGGGGTVSIALETRPRLAIHVTATDRGPGFPVSQADPIGERWAYRLAGQGLGMGLEGVRRLMDEVHIDSRPGEGATVVAIKIIHAEAR